MYKSLIVGMTFLVTIVGCSSVQVTKNPDDRSSGIRFYRPKPYLMVSPADPTGRMVKMKLHYLPDYNEGEYLVKVRGKAKVSLQDGWNLVGVNGEGPSPPNAPQDGADAPPPAPSDGKLPDMVVAATNVPIGFYESVLEPVGNKKVFRGWRYVGFSAMGGGATPGDPSLPICGHPQCPPTNENGQPCRYPEMPQPVFGLVSVNGVMTFREIGEIAMNNGCPFYVETPKPITEPANNNNQESGVRSGSSGGGVRSGSSATPSEIPDAIPTPPKPNVTPGSSSNVKPNGSNVNGRSGNSFDNLQLPPLPATSTSATTKPTGTISSKSSASAGRTTANKANATKSATVGTIKSASSLGTANPVVIGPKSDSSTSPTSYKPVDYSKLLDNAYQGVK